MEDGSCTAEVGHRLDEIDIWLVKTINNRVIPADEVISQFLETHHFFGRGEFLVEGNLLLGDVSAPEPHIAFVHQVLQLVLILLYLPVLLTDRCFVLPVLDKEVALLGQVTDGERDIQQFPLFVVNGVYAHFGIAVYVSL